MKIQGNVGRKVKFLKDYGFIKKGEVGVIKQNVLTREYYIDLGVHLHFIFNDCDYIELIKEDK